MMEFIYKHGYAIPEYIQQERGRYVPRGGAFVTEQAPRGTYDDLRPGDPGLLGALGSIDFKKHLPIIAIAGVALVVLLRKR